MIVPRALNGFDVNAAIGRMLDQPELWWEAVGLFVAHFADWERTWRESIGDDALERKRVHAVRSAAANVGAVHLADAAGALEEMLLKLEDGAPVDSPANLRTVLSHAFREAWSAAAVARQATDLGAGEPM